MLRFVSDGADVRADGGKSTSRDLPPAAFWGTRTRENGRRFPISPSSQNCRRRTAPARGPSAVYPHHRPIRNATQHPSPLLVGLGCVNTEPTALVAGTAGPPARGAWAREHGAEGAGWRHCRPLRAGLGCVNTPPTAPPPVPNRRRRTAPALGPSAVYAHYCRNRTETKHPSPLLVGLGCVNTAPTALAAGTAGPPARGAWVREHAAEG